jgi:hypothetical protein
LTIDPSRAGLSLSSGNVKTVHPGEGYALYRLEDDESDEIDRKGEAARLRRKDALACH